MADQLSKGDPDGTVLGKSTTDLIGFHGTTGTAQRSGSAQATLSLTTIITVSSGFGFATSDGGNQLFAQVSEIRAALIAKGLIKGSA